MSTTHTIAAGLIGLVVAGAGAVGVYNFSTTGCFLGSCSSGKTATSGETSNVGLVADTAEGAADSCCSLKQASEVTLAADTAETTKAGSCCPLGEANEAKLTLASDTVESCEGKDECVKPCDADKGEGCCGACGIAKTEDAPATDAPAPADG